VKKPHYIVAVILFCLIPFIFLYAQQVKINSEQTQFALDSQRLRAIEERLDKLEIRHELHSDKEQGQYDLITNRLTALELTVTHHEQLLWVFIGMVLLIITEKILSMAFRKSNAVEKLIGRN